MKINIKRILGIIYLIGGVFLLVAALGSMLSGYIGGGMMFLCIFFFWWIGLGTVANKVK